MQKWFVIVIVITIVGVMLTACGKKEEVTEEAKETIKAADSLEKKDATDANEVKKPEKITAMLDIVVNLEKGQEFFVQEYEEMTGIELEILQPPHNQYKDKLRLSFTSGDIPDVVEIDNKTYGEFAAEGAFAAIGSYIEKSEPMQMIDQTYIEAVRMNDGHIYGVPLNQGGGTVTYIRQDWLNNLGLDVPKNWEEFYNVMYAFTHNDPDQNGKDDTVGYTAPGIKTDMYLRDFLQDGTPDFILRDGKWVDGYSEPAYTEALGRLRKAYADKILDPEIFTNKTSTCRQKFFASKVGIFQYWSGGWGVKMDQETRISSGDHARVIPIPAIEETYYRNRIAPIHAVTSVAKNPEGVFKWFIEYMHDGADGQMLFTHGVEGVHYNMEHGKLVKLPDLVDAKKTFSKAYIHPELQLTPWEDPYVLDERIVVSRDIHIDSMIQDKMLPATPTYSKRGADLLKLKEELTAKAIIGELTVEEAMSQYKKESEALEINKIIEELNK